jgi:hypothetical protein
VRRTIAHDLETFGALAPASAVQLKRAGSWAIPAARWVEHPLANPAQQRQAAQRRF